MKKSNFLHGFNAAIILLISMMLLPCLVSAQAKGTFTDVRDGRVYAWVKIGTQTWMGENLKFAAHTGCWTYDNDSTKVATNGRLYTWKTAQTSCPKGWHVPSDKEWGSLIQTLGGSDLAGQKMLAMDTIYKSRFLSLLSGVRHPDSTFTGINHWGGFWTSGKANDSVSNNVLFAFGRKDLGTSTNDKMAGFSVRCVKK